MQRLTNRALYSTLQAWQEWTQKRGELRLRLQHAVAHWRHQALAAAFARFRFDELFQKISECCNL